LRVTFLPGDNYRHNVETAAALRRAGFNPVPHIAAREMPSREALSDFLSGAGASRGGCKAHRSDSMRALRGQIGRFGRLLTNTGPDDVMRGLQSAPENRDGSDRRIPSVPVRRAAQGR